MRYLVLVLALLGAGCGSNQETKVAEKQQPSAEGSKVLFVIAHQRFRDEELSQPKAILEDNGYQTVVASTDTTLATGMLGAEVAPELLISQAQTDDYQALVIVGGAGAKELWNDTTLIRLVAEFHSEDKVLGAICLAPVVFARAGILEGKKATCFHSASSQLEAEGVKYLKEDVVRTGNILTASGPKAAQAFGKKLLSMLVDSTG